MLSREKSRKVPAYRIIEMTAVNHHSYAGYAEVGISKGFVRLKVIVVLRVPGKDTKKVIAKPENAVNLKFILKDSSHVQPK